MSWILNADHLSSFQAKPDWAEQSHGENQIKKNHRLQIPSGSYQDGCVHLKEITNHKSAWNIANANPIQEPDNIENLNVTVLTVRSWLK